MTEIPLPSATIVVATHLARLNQSAYLQQWLYRIDDVENRHNNRYRAERHLPRQSALAAGKLVLGSYAHLDDMELRDDLGTVDDPEWRILWQVMLDAQTARERAEAIKVSPSTEYRRRRGEGKVGKVGRPRKA
jgi:hypothetical protein